MENQKTIIKPKQLIIKDTVCGCGKAINSKWPKCFKCLQKTKEAMKQCMLQID